MAVFINCYGNYSSKQTKTPLTIHTSTKIKQTQSILSKQSFTNIKSKIFTSVQLTNLKYLVQQSDIDKGIIEITGLYDINFCYGFSILNKIRFYCYSSQIVIFSTLLRNSIPFRIKNKGHRLLINKFVLRINSMLKYGSFRLDAWTGEFSLCFNNIFSSLQYYELFQKLSKLTEYLEEQFLKSKYFLRIYLPKILHIINQLPDSFSQDPQLSNIKIKSMSSHHKKTQQTVKKILPTIQLQYPFMYSDCTYTGQKQLSVDQTKKLTEIIKAVKCTKKILNNCILKIGKLIVGRRSQPNLQQNFNQQQKQDFLSILIQPIVRYQNGQPTNIYAQIEIINPVNNWQLIDQGGFGVISKSFVKFGFKQTNSKNKQFNINNTNIFAKYLVKKQDHQPDAKKLTHQKQILSTLKNSSSPFIAKFYYSQQKQYKNTLLIQYCSQKSLSIVRQRNIQFMSLFTKLLYLKYIAQSIKFLKDHQIFHLDIKPSNILIGSGVVKLTDFGESYHPQKCAKNFRPGTSLPYAPPQSFSNNYINFNNKMDVFSLGMVMYQLLYQCFPFDYSSLRYDIFKQSYIQPPQKITRQGYSQIHYLLKYIILRCIDEDQRKRPCIQWIIILLQFCINLEIQLHL